MYSDLPLSGKNSVANLHTHTPFCKHAKGSPAEFCSAAEKHSLILGFSDHGPFPDNRYNAERMDFSQITEYMKYIENARISHPDMTILAGVEIEWCNDMGKAYYTDVLRGSCQLDYLIGSAHYSGFDIGSQAFFYDYKPDSKKLKDFAEVTIKMMETGVFDFIAHPDAFMIPCNETTPEHISIFRDILEAAIAFEMPVELNAAGVRLNRKYPCSAFWEMAAEYPTLETLVNSDAHAPEQLYDHAFFQALDYAEKLNLNICNNKIAEKIIERKKK